jgi:hypothetical protein
MPVVEDSITIDAPAAGLFALSQDYALRRAWDPFVRDMRFLDGAAEAGRGVRVWVRAWTGLTMEVEFTGFRPPSTSTEGRQAGSTEGRQAGVAMRMLRGPWFLERFAGTWLFRPRPGGASTVTFRYSFTVRGRWLRPLLNPIVAWVFRRDVRARLLGLKRGAEQDGLLDKLGQPCA